MSHPSRRTFLYSAAALATASALPRRAHASRADDVFTNASTALLKGGQVTEEQLRGLVGTLFMAFVPNRDVAWLRLKTVEKYKTREKRAKFDFLHLTFATGGVVLAQDSYLLDHGTLGRFALFLVPGTNPAGEPACTAVISRPAAA